ncbi:BTB/POZ domain and ankyrin repeat-containing protein NPR3-like [Phragmites australis]|uniref:BTB/POZ domain and ankyrin repeat-containing protein NPR3-like n=1 Tax=Phragmites australis TaxID=29695 RepID=UPI002D77CCCF|nr:BTB/POZ domain and ankyrin repeat-containing protein NPR3-like [Phragmites australis]
METCTIRFSSPSPQSPPQRATPTELEAVQLRRLSDNLERLLDPAFLNCADSEIVLATGGGDPVGIHRCILAARSSFFLDHFSSLPAAGEKARLELTELVPGGHHIGRDALVAVLGYLYTGRLKPPPQEAAVCMDDACAHEACRAAIDFVVESTYAAAGFQISELVSLYLRRLSGFVNIALDEDVVPIVHVASTCQLQDLLNQCIQRVAVSTLNSRYLEKELPDDTYGKIKEIRRNTFPDEWENVILDPEHEKRVRNILKALDSDDVDLVGMLLKESAVTLDDAFAIHYAAAYCEPKVLAELLKLNSASVNLKNNSGYTPLHMACMRREPDIILSLVERGASVLERTPDGRDSLSICKRLTREKDCNRMLKKYEERSKAYLCVDILEQELKRKSFIFEPISIEESIATPLLVDNFHMRLINLENRVAFARIFFPSEAKLVMRIAQADSTEEFAGVTNFSKLKEVDLNETPTMQNRRLRERLDALTKTVELGRRYFPHCSDVLDKFLNEESTDLIFLETGTPEDQRVKRMRFSELKEDVRKAFTKDKAAVAAIVPSASSSSSPRYEGRGRQWNRKPKPSRQYQ